MTEKGWTMDAIWEIAWELLKLGGAASLYLVGKGIGEIKPLLGEPEPGKLDRYVQSLPAVVVGGAMTSASGIRDPVAFGIVTVLVFAGTYHGLRVRKEQRRLEQSRKLQE